MIIDTNIFIDFFKGNTEAKSFLADDIEMSTSQIVLMEIITGFKKKNEIKKLEKFLKNAKIAVLPISSDISNLASDLFSKYFHSTSLGIPDAFIAATSILTKQPLATLNLKHFNKIKELTAVKPY